MEAPETPAVELGQLDPRKERIQVVQATPSLRVVPPQRDGVVNLFLLLQWAGPIKKSGDIIEVRVACPPVDLTHREQLTYVLKIV